ncbi:class B sortase [Christensenellaceae bacterium OttesenSCG-928-M15]|nr:class B sortase [Christensenellaceae bacterium OttesenSCG-928-M15]
MTKREMDASTRKKARRILNIGMAVCVVALGFVVVRLVGIAAEYTAAADAYESLMLQYAPAPAEDMEKADDPAHRAQLILDAAEGRAQTARELMALNGDYIGWLEISGTDISYPVVRGEDNEVYLKRTFLGESNPAGSLFMDASNSRGFEGLHAVIYGHNMKDGSMFGTLDAYLNETFLEAHPYITITTTEGRRLTYCVFQAIKTTSSDALYEKSILNVMSDGYEAFMDLMRERALPGGTISVLTLSTCGTGGGSARVLVHAAYVG